MNSCSFVGRLTKDVDLKEYGETKIATTTVAVKRKFQREDKPDADFVRIKLFNKGAEIFEQYVKKGHRIALECEYQTDSFVGEDGEPVYTNEFIVRDFTFLETRAEAEKMEGNSESSDARPKAKRRTKKIEPPAEEFEEFEDDMEDAI